MEDSIHERGKAIEDLFFIQKDQELLAKLKQQMASEESRQALESASGIHDASVLDALLAQHITPETLTSIGLVPLIAVAWADNVIDDAERTAILQAADISGVKLGSPAYAILEHWLTEKPDPKLLDSWKAYVQGLKSTLDSTSFNQLHNQVLQRADKVAKAAGGFLGLGSKVSDAEQRVLDELAAAFG